MSLKDWRWSRLHFQNGRWFILFGAKKLSFLWRWKDERWKIQIQILEEYFEVLCLSLFSDENHFFFLRDETKTKEFFFSWTLKHYKWYRIIIIVKN